jgi:TFIIF-interacting CTD phosphatase-like protein
MVIDNFNKTIDHWVAELKKYTLDQLLTKPEPTSWSMGQVYMHLIDETRWYMEQVESCLNGDMNASEQMTEEARRTFSNDAFADRRIKGDPFISDNVKQPVSKSQLQKDMLNLKSDMNKLWSSVVTIKSTGKTRHPGLGYFSAEEWVHYADLHMRHHMRQKVRIEGTLNTVQ